MIGYIYFIAKFCCQHAKKTKHWMQDIISCSHHLILKEGLYFLLQRLDSTYCYTFATYISAVSKQTIWNLLLPPIAKANILSRQIVKVIQTKCEISFDQHIHIVNYDPIHFLQIASFCSYNS